MLFFNKLSFLYLNINLNLKYQCLFFSASTKKDGCCRGLVVDLELEVSDIFFVFIAVVFVVCILFGLFKILESSEIEQEDYKHISAEMYKAKQKGESVIINTILNATEDKIVTVGEYGQIKDAINKTYMEQNSEKAKLLNQVAVLKLEQAQK